ncbi:indolepyruvate ferredoxin oxidoreductase subunit alpha [Streptomyces sp. CMB-StM0423]|uniref:indolepyruvate ferredoxin oxidoreductase subunit alpha n=1 Tax=Streptomyces sp. CMB-StM0423 TaxID=2059884 RepID=UPI001F3B00E5|nr:4Fe-4S binding protein [Streptomyces sp. CMB-StM0423]
MNARTRTAAPPAEHTSARATAADGPAPRPAGPPALTLTVNDRCTGCGACLLTCPAHAIRPRGGSLFVRADLCTGCLECVEVCPADAIDEAPEEHP